MLMDPAGKRREMAQGYLQPHDIVARRQADQLLGGVQRARAQGVHGAGGLDGARLARNYAAEGQYESGVQGVLMQQEAAERQRQIQEARLRAAMETQRIGNIVNTATNLGSSLGAGIIGLARPGLNMEADYEQEAVGSSYGVPSGNFSLGGAVNRRFM